MCKGEYQAIYIMCIRPQGCDFDKSVGVQVCDDEAALSGCLGDRIEGTMDLGLSFDSDAGLLISQ